MAFRGGLGGLICLLAAIGLSHCDAAPRRRDTTGVQTFGRWEWHGHLVVTPDPRFTLVRMRIDTGGRDAGDVVLARYDFNPTPELGEEYSLALGLEFGRVRDLRPYETYSLGSANARVLGHATVTCLCSPLRPDSIRGTFELGTRGLRQLTGRVDATLYFTEWNDPARHATYALHQRLDAVK